MELAAFNAAVTGGRGYVDLGASRSDGGDPLRPATAALYLTTGRESLMAYHRCAPGFGTCGLSARRCFEHHGRCCSTAAAAAVGQGVGCVLDSLHALLITGATTWTRQLMAEAIRPPITLARAFTDAWGVRAIAGALQQGMPVLGICRGSSLSVALGGCCTSTCPTSLYSGHRAKTGSSPGCRSTASGTQLAELIGESADVPYYHRKPSMGR